MYTIRQAADLLDMPPRVIRRLVNDGDVQGAVRAEGKNGETWRLPPEAIDSLRQRRPLAPSAVSSFISPVNSALADLAEQRAGRPLGLPAGEHLVPMSVVVDLLQGEADQRRQAQRMNEDQQATVVLLRDALDQERDEVLRLRCEIAELRQQLQEAQSGLFRIQRRPMQQVDAERPTQPLDMEVLRRIAEQADHASKMGLPQTA